MVKQELLERAWPQGYLAMPGVRTIGNYICVRGEPQPQFICLAGEEVGIISPDMPTSFRYTVLSGDLLPNVDPTDYATWACLLVDLAKAAGIYESGDYAPPWGFSSGVKKWNNGVPIPISNAVFTIRGYKIELGMSFDDEAEALVLAIIRCRSK